MIPLLLVLGLGFVLCIALIPLAGALALRIGLVDQPDGHRKMHKNPTPVSGGIAILVSGILAVTGGIICSETLRDHLFAQGWPLLGLLLGSLFICALGVLDDFGHLRALHKLLGQIVAVGIVIGLGVSVHTISIFGMEVDLGWLSVPFTLFLMLGAINSINLIDGMDGMLGSVGVILSLTMAAMAYLAGQWWAATIALALAGALFGFLRYNLPPARIFMGDSGSMLVGLVIGTLAIHSSLKAPTTLAIATPVVLLILPIFDTIAAIVRRKLTGRSIYTTDRGHLHHCLLGQGFSTPGVLMVVSACCLLASGGVLASHAFNNEWIALITGASIIATLVATRLFGHAEAMLIKVRLLELLVPGNKVRHMEVRLQGSADWKMLWQSLKVRAAELNLQNMFLDVNAPSLHEGYHARWDQGDQDLQENTQLWLIEIPMTAHAQAVGRLRLSGKPDKQPVWVKIAAVMKVVEEFNHPVSMIAGGDPQRSAVQPAIQAPLATRELALAGSPLSPHSGLGIEALQS